MIDDDDFYNYGTPWGQGQLGTLCEYANLTKTEALEIIAQMTKRMPFIGFYENKEKSNALHDRRKTGLQKGRRVGQKPSGPGARSKRTA